MTHKFPKRLRHITAEAAAEHDMDCRTFAQVLVVTRNYINGEILSYSEWISELRRLGLNVAGGFTILTPEQNRKRLENLTKRFPRVGGIVPLAAKIANARR